MPHNWAQSSVRSKSGSDLVIGLPEYTGRLLADKNAMDSVFIEKRCFKIECRKEVGVLQYRLLLLLLWCFKADGEIL